MASSQQREAAHYPTVASWLARYRSCFKTAINTGLQHSRIDVVGVRDVGGDLSGEIETISVEVKRGNGPFATATGQALGYRVYANRIYLAEVRARPFEQSEVEIASHLGVGLIRINGRRCFEELSSPYYKPITRMSLLLVEKLGLAHCQFCGSFFEIAPLPKKNLYANVTRENLRKAARDGKGIWFWNWEMGERKKRLGVRETRFDTVERRFICKDCVRTVLSQLLP